MAGNIVCDRQKGKPKKGQKMAQPPGTKEGRELVPLLYKANWETFGISFS